MKTFLPPGLHQGLAETACNIQLDRHLVAGTLDQRPARLFAERRQVKSQFVGFFLVTSRRGVFRVRLAPRRSPANSCKAWPKPSHARAIFTPRSDCSSSKRISAARQGKGGSSASVNFAAATELDILGEHAVQDFGRRAA